MVMENGLHPYQDFAHFHMPNLVYIYAPLFLTDNPILYARILTGLCAFGICFVIFWHGRYLLSDLHWFPRIVVPAMTVILLLHSHIFKHSVSHVWNHAISVFPALLAFVLLIRWRRNPEATWLIGICGLTLGMAIGIRLTVVLLVIPFLFAILMHPVSSSAQRRRNFLVFTVSGLAANLPALYFLFFSFSEFWYGNMNYPHLFTEYYNEIDFQRAMDLPGKLRYFFLSQENEWDFTTADWLCGNCQHNFIYCLSCCPQNDHPV